MSIEVLQDFKQALLECLVRRFGLMSVIALQIDFSVVPLQYFAGDIALYRKVLLKSGSRKTVPDH